MRLCLLRGIMNSGGVVGVEMNDMKTSGTVSGSAGNAKPSRLGSVS